jgi:D-alanyl-D-alanine carboxypeptidase
MKSYIVIIILSFFCFDLFSQDFNRAKMDSLFTKIVEMDKGMGSISIFKKGQEIYHNAFGYADFNNKKEINYETKFRVGSVSKSFAATIIMKLIEDGKLSLNSNLSDYYPDLPNAEKIKIEHLLRHRSGLFDFTKSPDYKNWITNDMSKNELLAIFKENGTVFEPNEKTEYSNTNYELLAFIAEDITGKTFSDIVVEQIIEPLELQNTIYGSKINTENNEALSYYKLDPWREQIETNLSLAVGSGAIASNPHDINLFYYKLFSGKILNQESLYEMQTITDNFGIGLMQSQFYEKVALGHNGAIDGFQARAKFFPDDSLVVTYLTNAIDMPVDEILFGALSIYYKRNYTIPDLQPDIDSISPDLYQYIGIYTNPDFPLDITITTDGSFLTAQATNQTSFVLEPYVLHKFKYDPVNLVMEFSPDKNKMILKQFGGVIEFTREQVSSEIYFNEDKTKIYPNPNNGIFNIDLPYSCNDSNIKIH